MTSHETAAATLAERGLRVMREPYADGMVGRPRHPDDRRRHHRRAVDLAPVSGDTLRVVGCRSGGRGPGAEEGAMATFVTVTTRGMTSQRLFVNLDNVAWMVSMGEHQTRIYFASLPDTERRVGTPFAIEVTESPEEIMGRAGGGAAG
jgi:hypothetical protein